MCKKLMFLISLVLVLGLASVASATDYEWTNAYPWSYLWISPWNWDPVGVPSSCDDDVKVPPVGPIVVDTDVTVGEIRGPAYDGDDDGEFYCIKDCNLYVCDNWEVRDTDPNTGTIWIGDDANVSVKSFRCHGDDGRAIINMTENGELICRSDLRFGDEDNDYFELNMTNNAYLFVENDDDRMRADRGEFHIDLSGNAVAEVARIRARMRTEGITCTFTARDDAQWICTDGYFRTTGGKSNLIMDVLDNAIVDVDGYIGFGEDNDWEGWAILNMSGQLLRTADDFRFIMDDRGKGTVTVNLTSGLIDVREGELRDEGRDDLWHVNQCGDGVWVLDGDVVDDIYEHADEGRWVACPMEDCWGEISPRGNLMVEYDTVEFPGDTKIWVYLDLELPWAPKPADEATDVPSLGTELCWCPGDEPEGGIKLFHVWMSTDADAVANRESEAFAAQVWPPENCYDPGPLALCTTYYWAVDTQDHYTNILRGPVWSFTVECCRLIEGMEEYATNPDLIYDTWLDGCGNIDGMYGNGTGSCVDLSMAIVHEGAKSMWYAYENEMVSGWERDANYSEAVRCFDEPLDLTTTGEAALVAYFYGDGDNASTEMWMLLNSPCTIDGFPNNNVQGMATYGDNGEDPDDIKLEEWTEWNMEISNFTDAGIDLTAVSSLSIGFGDKATNVEQPGVTGVVHFDDISVCPVRCVPRFTPDICDLNEDCIVDWKDVKIIGDSWLDDLR